MHRHAYMTSYILLHVAYMLILCRLLTFLYVRLHSCKFDYMYQSCRLITRIDRLCSTTCIYSYVQLIWHCLCMLMVACGNVYNGVMVFVMHEVIACIVDMAMN